MSARHHNVVPVVPRNTDPKKMLTKQEILAFLSPLTLTTGRLGSWPNEDTSATVFECLANNEAEPITKVQLNQLLALGHEAHLSNDFFERYWLRRPVRHPYNVEFLPDFDATWLKQTAIV